MMDKVQKHNIPNNQRNSSIELCRIIVMFMIVLCHFATFGGFKFDNSTISIPRIWWHFIEMGGVFGVDVFVLISGYFLVSDTKLTINFKKLFRLWGQVFFYSIVLFALACVTGIIDFSGNQLLKALFPVITDSWWFVTTYIVLYLIHPYINKLLLGLGKRQYQNLLLIEFGIWCVIPTLTSFKLASSDLIDFIFLYTIAGYIKLHGHTTKLKSRHYFIIWIIATLFTLSSSIAFMILGKRIPFFADRALAFYGRKSLPTLIRAISFFMIFERMRIPYHRMINLVSSATLGVYLIHENSNIKLFLWNTLFKNSQYQDSLLIIPYSIFVAAVVFLVCMLIDLSRKKLIEPIYMQTIDTLCRKTENKTKKITAQIRKLLFGNNP